MTRVHRLPLSINPRALALAVLLGLIGARAPAQTAPAPESDAPQLSLSAFGTIGAATSNRPWRYQRFIDDSVTFERDSVFGAQADVQINPQWSATVQARLAPAPDSDSRWSLTPTWAFVAWRPNNDWLVRLGKLRVPFLLRSEHLDVGQTYDEARLPAEIYTLPPTNDFTGGHASRTWSVRGGDLSVEGYFGGSDLTKRFWIRDPIPSPMPGAPDLLAAGPVFKKVNVSVRGLVLTWREPETLARAGLHYAYTRRTDGGGLLVRPNWAPLGPGIGYWQTETSQPGPGIQEVPRIRNLLFTAGADVQLNAGLRVAGELLRIRQFDSEVGADVWAAYGTVYRSLGRFTPYVTLATAHTTAQGAYWANQLDTTTVPGVVPGAGLLNASMRASADTTSVYRQSSLALGSSYALTSRQKLKLEWLHTQARHSLLIDAPSGEPLNMPRSVNVLSASYSFVF